MELPQNQIADLVKEFPGTRHYEEAGYTYFFVSDLPDLRADLVCLFLEDRSIRIMSRGSRERNA